MVVKRVRAEERHPDERGHLPEPLKVENRKGQASTLLNGNERELRERETACETVENFRFDPLIGIGTLS